MSEVLIGLKVNTAIANNFGQNLDYALYRYGIKDTDEIAIFLANAIIESAYFRKLREDCYYRSADVARNTFKIFKTVDPAPYLCNSRKLANFVYNARNGNRPNTDDGYNYRGGGIFQLTGRNNYVEANSVLNGKYDIVSNPDDIVIARVACLTAVFYFKKNLLDKTLHSNGANGPKMVCNRINTGRPNINAHQLDERLNLYRAALPLLQEYKNHYDQYTDNTM